jgi:tetratricopeptide (TPR) repeat protein
MKTALMGTVEKPVARKYFKLFTFPGRLTKYKILQEAWMKKSLFSVLSLLALTFVLSSCRVVVVEGGAHPAYLRALSDLRLARAYLNKVTDSDVVAQEEADAVASINKAIGEIKKAAIEDGKNLKDHPVVDAALDRQGRFQKALELLKSARHDINKEEDNGNAEGLKDRALGHINNAINALAQHFRVLYPGIKIDIGL